MAVIKRTGGADFPDKLKALVSGPPKSGKTTLLGTIPNIIIADTEPRANNLASLAHLDVPYITVNGTADLRELHMVLGNDSLRAEAAQAVGMERIDAVAIDTLDTLQKIMKRERMEEQRTTKFVRDDWAWLKEEMTKIIESFTALPLHVIFTVHLKTQDVGTEKNPQTKFLPGLEGAIATEIAGMVGYSLLSFRKEEFDPASGQRYTKYWLQAEGDETYDFLGTRTAGRLPGIIEPDFGTIYRAAMAGRPAMQQAPTPQPLPNAQPQPQAQAPVQAPVQTQAPAQAAPEATPSVTQQAPVQSAPAAESGPNSGPPQQEAGPTSKAADDEPVSDAAMQHMKKVYDAIQVPFPEAKLRTITLGDARTLVKMWQACQADAAEGKLQDGSTAQSSMIDYLEAMELMPDPAQQSQEQPQEKVVEPKLGGTIAEAKAWVGDGSDLARVNQAFEFERTNGNRKSLMDWLESKGASHGGTAPAAPAGPPPGSEVQTPVETPAQAPEPVQTPVTPAPPTADAPPATEEAAVQAVREGLGGEVIDQQPNADGSCQECGKPLDDLDIAKLALTRFNKTLCVDHYIAATRG